MSWKRFAFGGLGANLSPLDSRLSSGEGGGGGGGGGRSTPDRFTMVLGAGVSWCEGGAWGRRRLFICFFFFSSDSFFFFSANLVPRVSTLVFATAIAQADMRPGMECLISCSVSVIWVCKLVQTALWCSFSTFRNWICVPLMMFFHLDLSCLLESSTCGDVLIFNPGSVRFLLRAVFVSLRIR